ncbi:MAG: hypothetical protein BAJATHORv1_30096 [Candidatus Thorarchaeota archaeon]|nr:MAG: hypothetical protein BAJATHORv1_30096 [Candidatus Thorarchaeota archaeon]
MTEKRTVFAYCKKCQENIGIDVNEGEVQSQSSGLATVLSIHGEPEHGIVVYIDKEYRVRGIEYPSQLRVERKRTTIIESTVATSFEESDISFGTLIDTFGDKRKNAIRNFSILITHVLLSKPIYLVHDDFSIGKAVQGRIEKLFSDQMNLIDVISHNEIANMPSDSLVFSLQMKKIMNKCVDCKTKVVEDMIKDSLKEDSSYFRFTYQVSKILYSYKKLKEILSEIDESILDTELSRRIMIEVDQIPYLLTLAELQGFDTSPVDYNGLGRVARSF